MLGDNRDNSADSCYIGLIQRKQLIRKAECILVSAHQLFWEIALLILLGGEYVAQMLVIWIQRAVRHCIEQALNLC